MLELKTRDDFVRFVERDYFGKMREEDIASVYSLFRPGARLIGYFGGNPARNMVHEPRAEGEESLLEFLSAAKGRFALEYRDFVHYVDLQAGSVASHFTLQITPKNSGLGQTERMLRNCNFFRFQDGLLREVIAYFASPGETSLPFNR